MATFPSSLPDLHRTFLESALSTLQADSRVVGLAVAGSYASDQLDIFSDLDLVIALEPEAFHQVMQQRQCVAQALAKPFRLLASFTGEHVGEPRLLIGLYQDLHQQLLHVDLKFVSVADAAVRVDQPQILWARDQRLADALTTPCQGYPQPQSQWLEDRFWIWIHYGATKIGRGELFEALDFLSFLRTQVLGPLALAAAKLPPSGVRKIELLLPQFAKQLQLTVAGYDAVQLQQAYQQAVVLYLQLRSETVTIKVDAQQAAQEYLAQL